MRPLFLAVALVAAACSTGEYVTMPATIQSHSTPLPLDAPSSLGFTGEEALALAQTRFATVEVQWTWAPAAPEAETFAFSFGSPVAAEERTVGYADGGGRTWVSVEVPVHITSASGHLSASDTVEVWATLDDEDALQAFVTWPEDEIRMNSTVSGPYAEAAEAKHDGLTFAHLYVLAHGFLLKDAPLGQSITVGAEYDNAQAAISGTVYSCGPSGDGPGDCLTFAE